MDKKQKKRIFVGFNGAGAIGIYNYVHVLKSRGYEIDFYGFNKGLLSKPVDILLKFSLNPIKSFFERFSYFFKILPKYDIWHFSFAETLFFYPLCLIILKLYGKKIVFTFHGSEVQTKLDFLDTNHIIKDNQANWPAYYKNYKQRSWQGKILRIIRTRIMTLLGDKVVISGPYLASSVSSYDQIIGNAQDMEKLLSYKKNSSQEKIIILHAPSDPKIKGTEFIKTAFSNLTAKYPQCEFRVLNLVDHDQLLQEMANADIIIDQLLVGWFGVQALEALALGKTVMCFINSPYTKLISYEEPIPIANTNFVSFESDLVKLIDSYIIKRPSNKEGQEFVKKYFDQEKIADEYEEIYKSLY